jgi:hypothetical protein
MIGIADPDQAETALAGGLLAGPGCTRALQPWGHARARTVRDHGHGTLALRPRRARCRTCRVTHVLLPAAVTVRRADTTAVIGSGLLASARGTGTGASPPSSTGRCPRCGAGSARSVMPTTSSGYARRACAGAQLDHDVLGGLRP